MNPTSISTFSEKHVRQSISDAQAALREIRESSNRWVDGSTDEWEDEDWSKGSIIVAEGLMCYLYPNIHLKEHFGSIKLPEQCLEDDIRGLISLAEFGLYHALPYIGEEVSFTETAAVLLTTFSHIMAKRSAIPSEMKGKHVNKMGKATRGLISFLTESCAQPSKGTLAWAPTTVILWSSHGIKKAKGMQLDTTYSTSVVLKGLYDAFSFYPGLTDEERGDLEDPIHQGIAGLIDLYDQSLYMFSRNKTSSEKNIIHTVFALEGLLYCDKMLDEHERFRSSIVDSVKTIIEYIGKDLTDLINFDQDIAWHFGYNEGDAAQLGIMDDRSTIGSIANCLCSSLRFIPPGPALENVYETIDALVIEFFNRRHRERNFWTGREFRVYYTMRMIEALTNCLIHRPEPTLSFSRRRLSQYLKQVLSSDEIVWLVTDKLIKQAGTTDFVDEEQD